MKKRRWAALTLSLLLVFQLAASPRAQAANYVFFVAAGDSVLPLSDATMPFWQEGYLYIASSIFTGTTRETLNIGCIRSDKDKLVMLYSGNPAKYLWFKWEKSYAYDADKNTYTPGAVYRNGEVYVPAATVAQFFGLQYSVNKVNSVVNGEPLQGSLAWLRRSGNTLTDKYFMDAASAVIASRYEAYLKEKGKDKDKGQQSTVSPVTPVPGGVDIDAKRIYLCMTAGEDTASLLDTLDRYRAQAAFFCTPEFMEQQGDLLRRMTATGQSIGILVDAGDKTRTVEEQLEAGNRALRQATCGGTRLAWLENGDEQIFQQVREAGYRCLQPDLNRSQYDLYSASNADSLLRALARRGDDVTVWLADRVDAAGLRNFLAEIKNDDGRCLAWTETT